MSSAHRSWKERREDRMANSVRTPEDNERARVEGRRQQIELIESALASGHLSPEQADDLRVEYGLPA